MSNFASGYVKYINHLEQINDAAVHDPEQMIAEVEGAYHECLQTIAGDLALHHPAARLVMLSGPSSSGKTTTAHLLRQYLRDFGKAAHIISLDDFYRGVEQLPLLPNGERDYESIEALDVERVKFSLKAVIDNDPLHVPRYDFSAGKPHPEEELYEIGPDEIVIVEGIHALNPVFTGELPPDCYVRLYVSVKQQIKDANGEVISPMDLRLVRRIVRDIQFRSTSAEETLAMWPGVEAGEDRYIRPYRISADYTVNSIHIYEPCVLRTVAIPLLRAIAEDSPHYRKARDLESRLLRFEPLPSDLVPATSMLREFLGDQSGFCS